MAPRIGLIALAAASVFTAPRGGSAADPAPALAAEAGNRFAVDLYRILSKADPALATSDGNLFISPHGLHVALAMTWAGARGETAAEMAKVLHLPDDPRVHASFAALLGRLNADRPFSYLIRHRPTGAILFMGRLVKPPASCSSPPTSSSRSSPPSSPHLTSTSSATTASWHPMPPSDCTSSPGAPSRTNRNPPIPRRGPAGTPGSSSSPASSGSSSPAPAVAAPCASWRP